ncbi:hypothetical protein ACFC09_21790 [Streptomyces sp. NPDC056161]|uniref:hypothetical protein n=1 Tax=Streptomyces sp. NPDC056161 TaxID=3345732 RepID=UPI0035DE0220
MYRERATPLMKGPDFAMPDDADEAISPGHPGAQSLWAEAVDRIRTPCGGHVLDRHDGSADEGPEIADAGDVRSAGHTADGRARVIGEPGRTAVAAGPRTTDPATGAAGACHAKSRTTRSRSRPGATARRSVPGPAPARCRGGPGSPGRAAADRRPGRPGRARPRIHESRPVQVR